MVGIEKQVKMPYFYLDRKGRSPFGFIKKKIETNQNLNSRFASTKY